MSDEWLFEQGRYLMQLAKPEVSVFDEIIHWHPSFNVYVFENKDVLLLSDCQQWWLPQSQFPYLDQLDGRRSCETILSNVSVLKTSMEATFYEQIQRLKSSNILVNVEHSDVYQRPDFESQSVPVVHDHSGIRVIHLSVVPDVGDIQSRLVNAAKAASLSHSREAVLTFILVDDFLDPRICSLQFDGVVEGPVLIIKVSGDAIWISPRYSVKDVSAFTKLQTRILNNQPVRKAAMNQWPDRIHSLPVKVDDRFTKKQLDDIQPLITSQLNSTGGQTLWVYQKSNHQTEGHPINEDLINDDDMEGQLFAPVLLQSCINSYNQDGGSRSVPSEHTVSKLSRLVSPITGIINHCRELELGKNHPVKVYRTGFFKTPPTLKPDVMEQGFVQICMGKGVAPIQSQASALCEAVERFCALYQGDLPLLKSTRSQLSEQGERSVSYQELVPYSDRQYQNFNTPDHPDSRLKQAAVPYQDQSIYWLPSWSLTHAQQVYVPLSQCFSHIPFDDEQYGCWHSNGCAAGNTLEEAVLQGLFELIERDAVAIWWYNQLSRPEFDLSLINQDNLARLKATLSPADGIGHDFWVLDLTMDVGVPVMAAIGKNNATGGFVMGFGCHLTPEIAAQRALTELCQLIPIRNQNGAPFDFDAMVDAEYLYPNATMSMPSKLLSKGQDIKEDVLTLVERLKTLGMETLVMNYSRAQIPLHTVKVFVPGLCHIWPQLANERLYKVPVDMGIHKTALTETQLNAQSLYI